ncbi:MAG: ABC transporter ATP-binding protein, partial [Candidatus Tectomicrobia bacterium]|nr:ABC transporter ATP-binding protein [Candidatus Tectomicrobia bacterium]
DEGVVKAVDGVSFTLCNGEVLGLVGESGSGKTVTALSILRLIETPPGRIVDGQILYRGADLLSLPVDRMRAIRGNEISMIFQEPMTSLNPVLSIGNQLVEVLMLHQKLTRKAAWTRAQEMLRLVNVPSPERQLISYPHLLSGGMRQRVMIAMALACSPSILIADEPTTALDVSIQAQILYLMRDLQKQMGTSIILITHDLGVVAEMCQQVIVMYAGQIMERASVHELFKAPHHPYTWGLLDSLPQIAASPQSRLIPIEGHPPDLLELPAGCPFHPRCRYAMEICREQTPEEIEVAPGHHLRCWLYPPAERSASEIRIKPQSEAGNGQRKALSQPLLEVKDLKKYFPVTTGLLRRHVGDVKAVDRVSFILHEGETLGLVGESGCGKTTTGRLILKLLEPTSGEILLKGKNLSALEKEELKTFRREVQLIFQDPFSSLNPRRTVGEILEQPLKVHEKTTRKERAALVDLLLEMVGLNPTHASRYPHEFSGGQRQRIGIARAIALHPKLIVADEPVSALDVSIQAQILNLLKDLQEELGLTYLFVAHDLRVVQYVSDRVAVMYLGKIVELASNVQLYMTPLHPYTQALLSAVPQLDPDKRREFIPLQGEVPTALNPPRGCHFSPRCPFRMPVCQEVEPEWKEVEESHWVACHLFS